MKKSKSFIKKYNYLLLTFLLGFIVICTIYKLQEIAPFGRNSMLTIDFFHQYGPLLAELYDRMHQCESLIYSFNVGLGIPFYRNFFNYLSSPINIIMFLFKRKNIIMSYSIIIGFKAILSSITMSYFLKNKFNYKNNSFIGLSLLYAFSAYFTAYYWNIMWLDGLIILPLIIYGIERIINNNNGLLYTISLTIMLYANYFIAYMICIFSVIYFISYLIIKTKKLEIKKILKKCFKFGLCSITAGLLMAWALIPMYDALSSTNATSGTMPTTQYYAFTFLEFFKNQLTAINSTVFASDISNCPNVSCGILSIALFLLFFLNKKISLKRKIIYPLILVILLLSFYIAPLDYIWHAFHVPNDLPYRYSFLYSFILIVIGAYSFKYIKEINYSKIIIAYILCIIYISIVYLSKYENISENMITINYLLISTYFLIYTLYHFYPKLKKIATITFISVISLECIISVNHNWDILQYIDEFYSSYDDVNNSIKIIKNKDPELFYRTEKDSILTLNDGAWYDYYGQTTFSSMAYNTISELNNDLGQPGNNINSYYYKQNTPVYDLMFDIKYNIGNNIDKTRYQLVLNENNYKTYKFKYNIGLMYGTDNSIKNWKYNYTNPLEYQNDFIKNSTNIEKIFTRLILLNKDIIVKDDKHTLVKYTYSNPNDNIYFYANNQQINFLVINNTAYYKNNTKTNDISIQTNTNINNYETYDETYIINTISKDDTIDLYIDYVTYSNEEPDIYSINNEKFINAYNILKANKVNISSFKENKIEGNINLSKDKTIYSSIPYDKGWKLYVNGKIENIFKINNSLLGFDLKKGKNNIILKYKPYNINVGLSISISTLIFSITYLIYKKKLINHQLN